MSILEFNDISSGLAVSIDDTCILELVIRMNAIVKKIWDEFVDKGEKVNSVDELKTMREQRNERAREWDI